VFGEELDVLERKARELQQVLESVEGNADVNPDKLTGLPVLQVRIKQDEIARYGIPARSILEMVESLGGTQVGEILEGQLRFPLAVWLPQRLRTTPDAVGRILFTAPSGERLTLARLADINVIEGPAKIMREASQRRIVVQCNVRGRDLGSFVAEAQQRVAERVPLPPGRYRMEWSGEFQNYQHARLRLFIVFPLT